MRSDLDSNQAFDQHFKSGKFSHSRMVLTGDVRITKNGSLVNALNPNGADRIVELPPFEAGRFYVVSHIGAANLLNIVTSTGASVAHLKTTESIVLFSSETEWSGTKSLLDLDDFGIAGPNHKRGLVPDPGPTPNPDPSHRAYLSELGWAEITEITGDDFYKYFKGGAVTLTPLGADTLELASANSLLTILASAVPTPDSILFTVNQALIDHNVLTNYVADQHVAHSGVTLTAGIGLAGGGNIAASRTFDLDLNDLVTDTPVLADLFAFYDVSGADTNKATLSVLNGILDHNALLNYVADRHIAHSGVSIIAGVGLTGGGDITTSRTLALDINGLTVDTIAVGDFLAFYDISGVDTNKITLANLNASLDHNSLLNYVANQHIDHTAVTLTAGAGLVGGGTIAASRTFDVGAGVGITVNVDDVALDTANTRNVDHAAVSISTTEGIQGGGTIAATRTLKLDINTLTVDSTPDLANDYLASWDASAATHKKVLLSNVGGAGGGAPTMPQGRLTLASATPMMTTNQLAKTTVFYALFFGNQIPLWNGTTFVMTTFTELSVATTDTTKSPAAIGASKMNDWFVWNDAGTIRVGHGPDWTNDTTRSLTLTRVNGLWTNTSAITNGPAAGFGTWVGTTRSNASSQIDWNLGGSASTGSAGFLGLANSYNQEPVYAQTRDSGTSYTYTSSTKRQARGSAQMQISFISLGENPVEAFATAVAQTGGTGTPAATMGVGLDTTSAFTGSTSVSGGPTGTVLAGHYPSYVGIPAVGFHFVSLNQASDNVNANTFNQQTSDSLSLVCFA